VKEFQGLLINEEPQFPQCHFLTAAPSEWLKRPKNDDNWRKYSMEDEEGKSDKHRI